jgi:intracellular multiplication protein IcmJ
MLPLELDMSPSNWMIFNGRKRDKAFHPLRDRIFQRDNYTCQYCGFQAREHQEVVNLDGDYHNNRMSNLATSCIFCAQSRFLSAVGIAYGGGKLIYFPELSQAEINSFCHVIFCAMMNRTGYLSSAQAAYRNLRLRAQPVEKKFGTNSSNPAVFCRLLLNQKTVNAENNQPLLQNVRLLASYTKFKTQLSDWAAAAVEELSQEQ